MFSEKGAFFTKFGQNCPNLIAYYLKNALKIQGHFTKALPLLFYMAPVAHKSAQRFLSNKHLSEKVPFSTWTTSNLQIRGTRKPLLIPDFL